MSVEDDRILRLVFQACGTTSVLSHLTTVAARAEGLSGLAKLNGEARDRVRMAALLHDIGKTPLYRKTDFHPIDSANAAVSMGRGDLCELIAHHTGARFEVQLRGITIPWPWRGGDEADILMLADLTTSVNGRALSLSERRLEITIRLGPDSLQARALESVWPLTATAAARLDPKGEIILI